MEIEFSNANFCTLLDVASNRRVAGSIPARGAAVAFSPTVPD
jgi:hypothetical protein